MLQIVIYKKLNFWEEYTPLAVAVTILAKLTKRAAFPNPQAKVEERPSISFMTSITIEVAAKASCRPGEK